MKQCCWSMPLGGVIGCWVYASNRCQSNLHKRNKVYFLLQFYWKCWMFMCKWLLCLRCPKWFGATGWSSDVRIFMSGNAATTVLAACGVQNRFDKIIEDSFTPCSFRTFTAWNEMDQPDKSNLFIHNVHQEFKLSTFRVSFMYLNNGITGWHNWIHE